MLDFNATKFFGINIRNGKVFHHLPMKWEFPSPSWVKINTDGMTRGYPDLATCGGIFRGSMEEFIGDFSAFIDVQTFWLMSFMMLNILRRSSKDESY